MFLSVAGLLACTAPSANEEADDQGSAVVSGASPRKVTCDARFTDDVGADDGTRAQELDVVLKPGAVARLSYGPTSEGVTVSVKSPDGTTRRPPRNSVYAVIANTWREPKTYRVKLERTIGIDSYVRINCYPLVDAPMRSGLNDAAMCKAGRPCIASTPEGDKDSICSDLATPNVGDDWNTGSCYSEQ